MKISSCRSKDHQQSKPLFVVLRKFQADAFAVRVRHIQLDQHKASKNLWLATDPKRQLILTRSGQASPNRPSVDYNLAEVLTKSFGRAALGS